MDYDVNTITMIEELKKEVSRSIQHLLNCKINYTK